MSFPFAAAFAAFFVAASNPVPVPSNAPPTPPAVQQVVPLIAADDLQVLMKNNAPFFLLDVRNPDEYNQGHIQGAVLMPVDTVPDNYQTLPKTMKLVVYCKAGVRSEIAVKFLRQHGYDNAVSLMGGYTAWSAAQKP